MESRYNTEKTAPADAVIIERIRRGDTGAFDELVKRHQQRAYQFAFRLTNNPDEAADIVADAFLRVLRSLDRFKGDSSFTTWLYRIETNCFLDHRKRARCRPSVSLEDMAPHDEGQLQMCAVDGSPSAHEYVETIERMTVLHSALARLPEHHQTILVMYHAEEMTYESIAEVLNLPIGTVKSRLSRARRSLHGVLKPSRRLFTLPIRRQRSLAIS